MLPSLECSVNFWTLSNNDFLKKSQLVLFVSSMSIDPTILEASKSTLKTIYLFPNSSSTPTFPQATKISFTRKNEENIIGLFPSVEELFVDDYCKDKVMKTIGDLFVVRNDWQIKLRSVVWQKKDRFTSEDVETLKAHECFPALKKDLNYYLKVTATDAGELKWEAIDWKAMVDVGWSHWELDQFFD